MPDWNPAEVVGTRPRRLALSLYQRLVTSDSWSRARARYGYHDLTGVPLLVDLGGLPYVDVRASAASLVPATVPLPVTRRVVDRYVQALVDHPTLHDKIEFEVVLSAWGPATPEWIGDRFTDVLQPAELEAFAGALRALTNDVVIGSCPWRDDLAALSGLAHGRERARRHPAGSPSRIADLLDSARVSGVVPFAGLARAAFIATQILDQGVRVGALDPGDRDAVLGQAESVTGAFLLAARNSTDDDSFLARYGHLRPGTYDVLSPRYDEHGGRYFLPLAGPGGPAPDGISVRGTAPATPTVMRRLDAVLSGCGCAFDAAAFCDFTARVVHGRELAKLEFTRNLSDALSEIVVWAERRGLSRTEVAHLRIEDLLDGGGRGDHDESEQGPGLRGLVTEGREEHDTATAVVLPPLLRRPADVWSFRQPPATPNFITRHRVLAGVADVDGGQDPRGRVALIASADPGYDWIFARGAVGVVTAFGGVNSHMAVRARELGVPTATGVGEDRFRRLLTVRAVELDAGAGVLRGIR
jgi:phosphohistidine swiveling domain-containing protein